MNRAPVATRLTRRPMLVAALALLCALLAAPSRAAVAFAPPDDSADAATEIKGIERELAEGNFPAAAKRLDALLAARANDLINVSEGTFASVPAWVDQLAPAQREGLAAAYAAAFAKPANQSLESLRTGRTPRPDELYSVARRYPMTPAAGAALAEAGDRALQLGDLPAAQAYYELAARESFALGDARAKRLEAVRAINAGATLAAPADLDGARAAAAKAVDRLPFAGPLPFDATWFGNPSLLGLARFFPAACDGRVVLASWNGVSMLRENGELLWRAPNPKPPGAFATDRPGYGGRGPVFAPAVLCDVYGRPLTVVVRQPTASGDGQYALRAFNAADGKLLWSTESSDQRKDLSYAGLPAVRGRYVYSLAATKTGPSAGALVLCATDVATGQSLWQTTLGTVNEQGEQRFGGKFGRTPPLSLESFAELSEPAVAGDLVLVAPNCGATIAVGRFDGKIRWVSVYREPEPAGAANPRQPGGGGRSGRWQNERDGERSLLVRYRSTPAVCGNVAVILPQDVPAMVAFDVAAGRRLWETDLNTADACALAGASGNIAVLCGGTLSGIDAGGTGKLKWKFTPARGVALTGPAVVVGQTVIAPTTAGLLQLDAADGARRAAYAVPDVRELLATDGGQRAVRDAGASRAFGVPPAAR